MKVPEAPECLRKIQKWFKSTINNVITNGTTSDDMYQSLALVINVCRHTLVIFEAIRPLPQVQCA